LSRTEFDSGRVRRAFSRFAADLGDRLDDYYAAARRIEERERQDGLAGGRGERSHVGPPSASGDVSRELRLS
jgi:hypothetical protein